MTTFRRIILAAAATAGLLASTIALANDVSSDRYFKSSAHPNRHPAAAAATAPAQEVKVEKAQAASATATAAHDCRCAHGA